MNKAFKVLWNQVRNTYVVASEAQTTHGKPGKATKTIVAAAVAGLMAVSGASLANTIEVNPEYAQEDNKLITGGNDDLNITTTASLGELVYELGQAGSFDDIRNAIEQDGKVITGVIGGHGVFDGNFDNPLTQISIKVAAGIWGVGDIYEEFADINTGSKLGGSVTENKNVTVGSSDSEPVILGMVGSDFVLGAMGDASFERSGDVTLDFISGNTLGLIGGSTGLSLSGIDILKDGEPFMNISFKGNSVTSINGSVTVKSLGSANIFGGAVGSLSLAMGGSSVSNINGGTNLKLGTTVDTANLEGLTVGVFNGGMAVATLGGTAQSNVNGTSSIEATSGMSLGLIGGGLAASSDFYSLWEGDPNVSTDGIFGLLQKVGTGVGDNFGFGGEENKDGLYLGGTSSVYTTQSIVNLGDNSTSAMTMGGSIAFANASQSQAESIAKATVDTVEMHLGMGAPEVGDKGSLYAGAKALFNAIRNGNSIKLPSITELQDILPKLNVPGVHVANMVGGLAIANSSEDGGIAQATSTVTNAKLFLEGGYNVANLAGGAAVASGTSGTQMLDEETSEVMASSKVTNVEVVISGGENILTAGGGGAYATAHQGQTTKVQAIAEVDNSVISVTGGIADGIYGGGIAIDDTNSSDTNATATTKNINVTVTGGEVNEANIDPIVSIAKGDVTNGAPTNGAYVNDTAYLIDAGNVAILGAGMASGGGALADTETSVINLNGGTITGSVFGGGAATFGGQTTVETSVITVAGADITGDIYGGGLAGSPRNDEANSDYQGATSTVSDSTIKLLSGTVNGDVYAGGYVFEDQESPKAVVTTSNIVLGSNDVLTKEDAKLDGQGAGTSTLTFVTDDFDMTGKTVIGFNTIDGSAQSVTGLAYSFGEKDKTYVLGNIAFTSVTDRDGKTMNIGTADRTGVASIKTLTDEELTDATIFNVANGLLSLNTDSTDAAVSAFAGAGAQNAVYVTGTVDNTYLAGSTVKVGDVADALNPGIYVGANGALIADADGDTSVESLTMNEGSKVHFADVALASEKGSVVVINVDESIATSVDNVLYTAVRNEGDKVSYTFTQRSAEALDEVGLGDVDDTEALGDISHQDDDASEYIKGFLDQSNTSIDSTNRSQQINAAMNLAAAAGVQTVAIDSAAMGIDAAAKRASLINDFAEGGVLFAEATGKRFEMGGSSDFGAIKADLGGLVVGGEYTMNDWTFGALANLGTGTVRGQDTNSGVKNDVDYYGVQAYAAKRFGSFNVVGQVGYVTTSNDVSHATAALDKADIDADVMSVGVRGEMRFDLTQNTRLVPYVGVNYLRVSTDGFHTKQGLEVKDQDQDIVTIPVGVKFAGDMQTASGWKWTPSMDIGYVAALGDRDTDARTKVGATTVHTSMDVWSESVVRTSFGLKAQKENWGFGVQAGSALGSDDTQELFGQVRVDYRF